MRLNKETENEITQHLSCLIKHFIRFTKKKTYF